MAKQLTADRERRAARSCAPRASGRGRAIASFRRGHQAIARFLAGRGPVSPRAQRDAEARERLGEAEAKATAAVSRAVAEGDVQALNYFIAQKYVEAMQQIGQSPNSRLVLMPMETSGLVGAIAGIAALASQDGAGIKWRRRAMPHFPWWAWAILAAVVGIAELRVPGGYLYLDRERHRHHRRGRGALRPHLPTSAADRASLRWRPARAASSAISSIAASRRGAARPTAPSISAT